jgi:4-hydroxy-tetrahydrodipicolinate synthase
MTALVTPFNNGRIDETAFIALCRRQINRGTAALVPCGTTGEASTLTHDEQLRVIALAVDAAEGRVPVIAGAGSNCTSTAVALVDQAERLGVDAVLSVVPYYNRPMQEGLYQHFSAIQANTNLPVLLYDVPARAGTALALDTIRRLAELPNIVGIKDATGDLLRAKELRRLVRADFLLLCGDDARVADFLALGSEGCISVTANVAPAACAALHRAWAANDLGRFQHLRGLLDTLTAALFIETNPISVKWALSRLGLIQDSLRLPLTSLDTRHQPLVMTALNAISATEAQEAAKLAQQPRAKMVGPSNAPSVEILRAS